MKQIHEDTTSRAIKDFNDSAINLPEDDLYGVNPFALVLAKQIADLKGTIGSTIALNGPWGSGKSSIVNLIRHHLKPYEENSELVVVNFTTWWFRGEEALTMAFLQELEAVCKKTLGAKAKDIFKKVRKRFTAKGAIGEWIKSAAEHDWKKATAKLASRYFTEAQSLEEVFALLGELLAEQDKRIVVIMDDLDRLTPDELLQIFRLVKSVGRLPKILYLLVFDREIAEREVSKAFPSEGPHFLEKIIQANFDIPPPERDILNAVLYDRIKDICGDHSDVDDNYFFNIFHSSVTPYINVPRHIVRLSNAITITFPPIRGQVNVADYLAIETMRLFEPALYEKVRRGKRSICGVSEQGDKDGEKIQPFLEVVPESRREVASEVLKRLFPRLQSAGYAAGFLDEWEANRQICADKYFDTYFRLQVGEHILSRDDLDEFLANIGDEAFVKRTLIDAIERRRRDGTSGIRVWLDELLSHSNRIPSKDVGQFLSGLFAIADDIICADKLDVRRDAVDNRYRIHWIMNKLTRERFSLSERSKILIDATKNASTAWLVHFALSAWDDYNPKEGLPEPLENCLVEKSEISGLRKQALDSLRAASANGSLLEHGKLGWLLYRWIELADDGGEETKRWIAMQMGSAKGVANLAGVFTNERFSQGFSMFGGLNDHVGKITRFIDFEEMKALVDPRAFRSRLYEAEKDSALDASEREKVKRAIDAWNGKDGKNEQH